MRQRIAHGREMRAQWANEQRMRDVPFLAVAGRPRVGDATGDTAGSGAARGSGEAAGGARLAGCAFLRPEANSVAALAFAPSLGVVAASAAAAPKENESLAATPRPRGDAGAGAAPRFFAGAVARLPVERRLGALSSRKASVAKAASAAEHSARPGSCGAAGKRVSARVKN